MKKFIIHSSLLGILFLFLSDTRAEVIDLTPSERNCSMLTGVSRGLSETIARDLEVSVFTIKLLRSGFVKNNGCYVTVDTPKGPKNFICSGVYSDGINTWVGNCW